MDTYTKTLLTIIALALVTIALRGIVDPIQPAWAGDMSCTIEGPLEIKEIRGFGDRLRVEIEQGFNQPGSSSGSPLYIKNTD